MAGSSVTELADMRVSHWVAEDRARKEHNVPPQLSTPPDRRVITISRQYGAGGHSVAELIAKNLGPKWEIWDKEIVDEVAKGAKVRTALVSALDEHSLSREEEILRYLTNCWGISPETYYKHLVQVLLALGQQGDKIIIGRGSSFVLRNALRVRLCATEAFRIKNVRTREELSEADARSRIAQVEAERARFISTFFHRNVNDPAAYDLIVHVDRVGLEPAAAAITAAMQAICAKTPAVARG